MKSPLPLLPFVNTNSFGPGRCWGAGQRSSTMRLVHESLEPTAQTGPIPFHLVQGQRTAARVKVMSWWPPASCIWMAAAPSVPV